MHIIKHLTFMIKNLINKRLYEFHFREIKMNNIKRIFISQGDGSLSGIEYSLINVLKNLTNYKWIIIADTRKEQKLCKYLNENNYSYSRFYLPKRKIKYLNIIFLYLKFLEKVFKERESIFYVSGIMMIIIIILIIIIHTHYCYYSFKT